MVRLGEARAGAGLNPVALFALVWRERWLSLCPATVGARGSPALGCLPMCVSVYLPLGFGKVAAQICPKGSAFAFCLKNLL